MIKGIEHVAILSKDTTKLKQWYIDALGFKEVFSNENNTYFLMAEDGMLLEFVMAGEDGGSYSEKATGIRHIAFKVDDFDGACSMLKSSNVEFYKEPISTPAGLRIQFFKEPEGNILHLVYRPNPFKIHC
jgi:glyoxylase I family protein